MTQDEAMREAYLNLLAELRTKAANAANRGKPTMWAYYRGMLESLGEWFADATDASDFLRRARQLHLDAADRSPALPPHEAARLWAMSVYARRLMWAVGVGHPAVSLEWLRRRAREDPS